MSIFATILVDVEKFFKGLETSAGKFVAAFVKLFRKAPQAIQVVENFLQEAAPLIVGATALADPAVEPAVAAALGVAEQGLASIEASATAANSGASLLANLQNFAATVPQLLSGLEIKNPALQTKVTRIVAFVTGEAKVLIPAVEAWVKQIAAASAPAGTATGN